MENLDLGAAISSIFQKNWWKKFLSILGIYILPIVVMILSIVLMLLGVASKNPLILAFSLLIGICLFLISMLGSLLVNLFITGYFMLYSHDIAHDKNAIYRPIFKKDTFKNALIAGAKNIIAGFVISPFVLALFISLAVVLITFLAFKMEVLGILLTFCLFFAGFFLIAIPITKIMSYFIKDMDLMSLFRWGRAFKYTKGVKDALLVVILPILVGIAGVILFAIVIAVIAMVLYACLHLSGFTNEKVISEIIRIFSNVIGGFSGLVLSVFYYNLLGQYTNAAIKQNENNESEVISKEIKNDNGVIIVIIAVIIMFSLLPVLGIVAALTIPSLVNRQSDLASLVKMKKAVSQYEIVTELYMAENDKKNLRSFAGQDCENLGNYFKIYKTDGNCSFETADEIYWQFDPSNGSAVVSDKKQNPKYTIRMGVCSDGSINCPQEYPDVEKILNKKPGN